MFKAELPPIYERNGRECYLDPIRKKLIYITPEETVRQRTISYLIKELSVPAEMIAVEEHLSHYGIKSKNRADIIIHGYVKEDNIKEPIAVIECKAPNVYLDERAGMQMVGYANDLLCLYAVLTNGNDTFCYIYDQESDSYKVIESLPNYKEMVKGIYSLLPEEAPPERTDFDGLPKEIDKYVGWEIGKDTENAVAFPCVNLCECLYDISRKLPVGRYGLFEIIDDMGVRTLSYGNAAGGAFSGLYRSFLLNYNNSTEIVSLGFSTYATEAHQDVGKTALCVAVDNEESAHHALQLVADDNLALNGDKCIFYHHGRIAVGKIGSGKIDELRQFVAAKCPEIIDGKRFNLGTLVNNRLWYMDDPEIIDLVKNLISYALIRDEYREYVKRNRN